MTLCLLQTEIRCASSGKAALISLDQNLEIIINYLNKFKENSKDLNFEILRKCNNIGIWLENSWNNNSLSNETIEEAELSLYCSLLAEKLIYKK